MSIWIIKINKYTVNLDSIKQLILNNWFNVESWLNIELFLKNY